MWNDCSKKGHEGQMIPIKKEWSFLQHSWVITDWTCDACRTESIAKKMAKEAFSKLKPIKINKT